MKVDEVTSSNLLERNFVTESCKRPGLTRYQPVAYLALKEPKKKR